MNTHASRERRTERLFSEHQQPSPRSKQSNAVDDRQNAALPNPWLFDTQELISALDRTRETMLRIPNATHEVYLRTLAAIDEIWRLREHLRELLAVHREMQRSFAKRAVTLPNSVSRHVRQPHTAAPAAECLPSTDRHPRKTHRIRS
jgi:hypothetical protein